MTKKQCKRYMDQKEFIEWQAYHRIEPFGVLQERLGFGYLCSMIANYLRSKDSRTFSPEDWFPELGTGKKKDDWTSTESQILIAQAWVVKSGGRIIEDKTSG